MNAFALTALVILAPTVLSLLLFVAAVINHHWQRRDHRKEDQP